MSVDEVRQASDRFYAALNRFFSGDTAEMLDICSHGDDATTMHPLGGRQTGWPEVRSVWEMAASANTEGSVTVDDLQVTLLGNDAAYTTGTETATATFDGAPVSLSGRCTNVYRRENGSWKLVHHHVDLQPDVAAVFQAAMGQAS